MRTSVKVLTFAVATAVSLTALHAQSQPERAAPLEMNKDVVERFFAAADKGDVTTLRSIVADGYIEHASYLSDSKDALLAAITQNQQLVGGVRKERSEIIRMIAERDQVWVYTRVNASGTLMARINMFRLEDGRIAEHWAVQEVVNTKRVNDNDQWAVGAGPANADLQPKRVTKAVGAQELERNKDVVRRFFASLDSPNPAERRKLLDIVTPGPSGYIQHNAGIANGIDSFVVAAYRGRHELVRMLAEGDYVWCLNIPQIDQRKGPGPERVNFNQWRLQNGKLIEQWGTYEDIQPTRANTNDFFGFGRTETRDLTR